MSRDRPRRLRQELGRFFIALAAGFVLVSTVVVFAAVLFVRVDNRLINKLEPAASASSRMLADLVNQETGVRGFILTGQETSLAPYNQYLVQQRDDTAEVRRLAGSERGIAVLIDAFDRSANQWQTDVARPLIAQVRAGGRPDTSALDRGKAHFDALRVRAAALRDALRSKVSETRHRRVVDGVTAAVALGVLMLGTVFAGGRVWFGLGRRILVPVEDLAAQTRAVASGDLAHHIHLDGPGEFIDLGNDIEGMRARIVDQLARAEEISEDLRRRGAELQRSNGDLQQFAYVASHDLSEPLRKVSNFCQLLDRQYGEQLDDRARQYIDFAVDGAKRMQALINDLLALSRVGRTTEAFVPVDLDAVLDHALGTLSESLNAAGGRVERLTALPTVDGDRALLVSLMQNLIGNAVKYHRDGVAPVVQVSAERDGRDWSIRVSDNGIGIEAQYAERIFAVFQRLHLRDQYGGTGIGLALCRRIVEFHGGHIHLDDSHEGDGASFVFSLPEGRRRAEPAT